MVSEAKLSGMSDMNAYSGQTLVIMGIQGARQVTTDM